MQQKAIGFIGGGNMTEAIVGGLLANNFDASSISIAEPNPTRRAHLQKRIADLRLVDSNAEVAERSDVVVIAVKPQIVATVCRDIRNVCQARRPLLVSIAAGVRSDDIDRWVGGDAAVARIMPNQPALIGQGVSGLYANGAVSDEQLALAETIMASIGVVVRVQTESDIDSITAISGSGPAYFFLLIAMLESAAQSFGLDAKQSHTLAIATATGAASLAASSDKSCDELIASVRSPGGTTAAALDSLTDDKVHDIFRQALRAARDRAIEMADAASQQP